MSVARWLNVVAGTWLFVSALLLPAPGWQRVMQGLMGMAIFLVAIVAMAYARFRWINTLLALCAVLAPFVLALPASAAA
jgi:preprotein translocase subunit SecF